MVYTIVGRTEGDEKGGTRRCEAGGQRSIKYQVSHDEHIRKPSSCNKVETYLDLMIYKFQKKIEKNKHHGKESNPRPPRI